MKKLQRTIIALIALVLVAVIAAGSMINLLAKLGVQAGASHALGVDSTVESLNIRLLSGQLRMEGLNIANPEGFKTDHLIHTGKFELEMVPLSIFTDTIEISKFELDGLDLIVEQQIGGSNISVISDNLSRFASDSQSDPAKEDKEKGKKVKVDKITIRNVRAHFYLLPGLEALGPLTVEVPEIELTEVTSDNATGVAVAELIRRIIPAILVAVSQKAEGIIPGDLVGDLRKQVGRMTDVLGEQAGKLTGQVREKASKILEGADDAIGKVEGLFKRFTDPED